MGIWDKILGSGKSEENNAVSWIALQGRDQLRQIALLSGKKPQLIYKHSSSCGISGMVLNRLEGMLQGDGIGADCYFLDVRRQREISDAIAAQYGVRHESPQLLIIKNGDVIASASHGAITGLDLGAHM